MRRRPLREFLWKCSLILLLTGGFLGAADDRAGLPSLVPRDVFFPPPPAIQTPRLSPDGQLISYTASDKSGAPQVWVRLAAGGDARQLTHVASPGVLSYVWAENADAVCYVQRLASGSGLAAVDVRSGRERMLVAIDGAEVGTATTRAAVPDQMLVTLRLPGAQDEDVYRVNVVTGLLTLDTKNPGRVPGNQFFADAGLVVRAVERITQDAGNEVLVRDDASSAWRTWLTADASHNLVVERFTPDGQALVLRSDLASDKSRLVARGMRDGREQVLAAAEDLDVENVLVHPRTGAVQAASFDADPRRWQILDRSLDADFGALQKMAGGFVGVASRDQSDRRWLVWLSTDNRSSRCYLWDRTSRRATFIFEQNPKLAGLRLPHVKTMYFKARDGLAFRGYLTLPLGVRAAGLPLVVWVHGGPFLRDGWGYDAVGQFFANRGYAFLRVNYRGSRGFGRRFSLVSFKQWGGTMQTDVVDAVESLVKSGTVDRRRMAIIGHSYGAYSALAGLTLTPDLFACGAASSGTADLVRFVGQVPRTPGNRWFFTTIGDPEIPDEREALRKASPMALVDRLTKPVLIARGDRDGAMVPGDLDGFAEAAVKRGQEATSIVYEGDGHFFRLENQRDFFARVEALFARCLGGRAEPMSGDRLPGSTAKIVVAPRAGTR